jgi:DNA-binding NtrC family response regulator
VGSDTTHHVDVRYVAATHKDLEALVNAGNFRRDLFERLAGIVIRIPPLRERPEDIRAIALSFVDHYTGDRGGGHMANVERWFDSGEARGYPWPGNVRELQNVLRNLLHGLPAGLAGKARPPAGTGAVPLPPELPQRILDGRASMQEVNDWYMRLVLEKTANNYTQRRRKYSASIVRPCAAAWVTERRAGAPRGREGGRCARAGSIVSTCPNSARSRASVSKVARRASRLSDRPASGAARRIDRPGRWPI